MTVAFVVLNPVSGTTYYAEAERSIHGQRGSLFSCEVTAFGEDGELLAVEQMTAIVHPIDAEDEGHDITFTWSDSYACMLMTRATVAATLYVPGVRVVGTISKLEVVLTSEG